MAEVRVGDQAPEFETVNDKNEKVKLSDYLGKRVVLYFYPRDETRGCTIQACGFRDVYPQIEEKNAVVLGVSPDDAESHRGFIDHHGLPFPLLVDTDKKIAEKYDVWRERERDGVKSMGIARSHFVIDEEGRIVEARYNVRAPDSAKLSLAALG
jgi:peroxiredoxin Q/BCP